jgi:dihydrofolate reductase
MSKIVAFENLTLDGVMQSPGRPDEDNRGGFPHGGWSTEYADETMLQNAQEGMAHTGALLFGRTTYEDFFQVWPNATDNPFTDVLNRSQKYVASTTLTEPLPWENSTLLQGDVVEAVRELRARPGKDIVILGSGKLVRSLMPHGLIDNFSLLIHPLVLGAGQHLFPTDWYADLELIDTRQSKTGVIMANYRNRRAA